MEEKKIVLTKPYFSLDGDSCGDHKAPNLIQRVLSLFKNVRPGSDLTKMQLPAHFNATKSFLQYFGESIYCVGSDMLGKCNSGESPLERFIAVVAWSISTMRPMIFGFAPYNSILGETHHVSRGSLNVLLEQISHHPPVTALYATDEKDNLEVLCCLHPTPKFYVEVVMHGKRKLKLLNHGETYTLSSPKIWVKFLPVPAIEWIGTCGIRCPETGLEAELTYGGKSFLGLRGNARSIKGKIFDSSSLKPLYEIGGHWDRTITLKDLDSGETRVIYNAKEVLCGLKTPIVKDPKGVLPSEAAVVWGEVSQGILSGEWGKATEAKKTVEERQRELLRERKSRGETWIPKHFIVSYNKEDGWDCSPKEKIVPPASIVVPF
ncbi:oxysterol-binding protein-related protein 4C isoform X2 [Morus notabilis]|uniref:oxysterol-binding protein-related protein 4C isoform X2 n=1 Tax=Morus notabilis TaxID=981085 RepID=UPI000CED54F7|nr:oxysterol-binding protein-related protein 4C isoform X2 [Morus notabilis]